METTAPRIVACAALLAALALLGADGTDPLPLEVGPGERLLVAAPHPDDETLGAGGLVQRVLARGGSVQVLLFTAGDGWVPAVVHATGSANPGPSDYIAYGEARLAEARAALDALGRDAVTLQVLGFPDGSLERLLDQHWHEPGRSATTLASQPPYYQALNPEVPYLGADLFREVERVVREVRPTLVALPDPADRHPDHRATALFTLLAVDAWRKTDEGRRVDPRLLAYLVHWEAWPQGWNAHQPPSIETALSLPFDLPTRGRRSVQLVLTDEERAAKATALDEHASQQVAMGPFLSAFVRRTEPFSVVSEPFVDPIVAEADPEEAPPVSAY
jgi:LmbE family N-acetylglucosaminyl deacetylase